jgi:hypothetical protein
MYKYCEPHPKPSFSGGAYVCVYSSYLVKVGFYSVTYRMEDKFEIIEVVRQYRRFDAEGTLLKVRLLPPPDETVTNPVTHFETSMNAV